MKKSHISTKKLTVLFVWLSVTLAYLVYRHTSDVLHATAETVWIASVVTVSLYIFSFVMWCVYTKKVFSIYFVFLVYCFLFNAGEIVIGIFDTTFTAEINIYMEYSSSLLMKMMLFQCDGVLAMTLGSVLAYRPEPYKSREDLPDLRRKRNMLSITDVLFIAFSLCLIVVYLREVALRGTSSYGDYYYGEREGISIPLLFAFHVCMYKVLVEHERDLVSKFAMLINVVITAMMLMVGSRNAMLQILFGSIFILFYVRKNKLTLSFVKVVVLIIAGLIGIVLMTGIQGLRGYSLSEISWDTIARVYEGGFEESITDALAQMGGSARCLLKTMNMIDVGAVQSEQTILYAFIKGFVLLPFLNLFGIKEPINLSLATWITNEAGSEFGWGYSILAEAYYDFEELGFLYLFVWAFVFVWLEGKALTLIKRERSWEGCALIYVLAYGIFISRADFTLMTSRIRYCFYMFVACYLFRQFFKSRKPPYVLPKEEKPA